MIPSLQHNEIEFDSRQILREEKESQLWFGANEERGEEYVLKKAIEKFYKKGTSIHFLNNM